MPQGVIILNKNMIDKSPAITEQKILLDLVNTLYGRSKSAIIFLLAISAVYLIVQASYFPWQHLLAWYGFLVLVTIGRWLLTKAYFRNKADIKHLNIWLRRFRYGILATGCTIGSLSFLFFPQQSLSHQMLATLFPMGLVAAILSMMPDFFSFVIYATTILLPVAYQTITIGDRLHIGISILTFSLLIFSIKFSRDFSNNFISSSKLLHENKNLVNDLEREKNKLSNRLGRILNDSSNEIFVADAQSLKILQVNRGARQNLGYTANEFTDITLLDIFCELDQNSWNELIKPLQNNSHQESVHFKGRNQRKNGTIYPIEATVQLSYQDSPPIIVATVQDITERYKWEQKLLYQANYDQLTGLLNRHYMHSYINSAFIRAQRNQNKLAIMFMDLDNFKTINDSLGHDVGDEVLKQTADRIRSLLRGSDTPIRSGGDEFMVLLEGLKDSDHANVVAGKLIKIFQEPFIVNLQEIYMTVSIGISIYPDDSVLMEQLLQYADMAMYHAKETGKNNYRFFSREMSKSSDERMLIAGHLRRAIENRELSLVFQPQINIGEKRIVGAEALLRWHNLQLGNVPPDKFIKIAEEIGFIEDIGNWVLEEACHEANLWQEISPFKPYVAVNISSQQFRAGTLMGGINNALENSGLEHQLLELEITESLLLQYEHNIKTIDALHAKGLRLALDDFGTGYSSLSYLKRFPLQVLKIDRSFNRDMVEDSNDRALVQAIIAMAHSLGLDVIAEGIETKQQLEFLRHYNVNVVQGYFFSPPLPAADFRELLRNGKQVLQKL